VPSRRSIGPCSHLLFLLLLLVFFAVKALVAVRRCGCSATRRAGEERISGRNKGACDRVPKISGELAAKRLALHPDLRMLLMLHVKKTARRAAAVPRSGSIRSEAAVVRLRCAPGRPRRSCVTKVVPRILGTTFGALSGADVRGLVLLWAHKTCRAGCFRSWEQLHAARMAMATYPDIRRRVGRDPQRPAPAEGRHPPLSRVEGPSRVLPGGDLAADVGRPAPGRPVRTVDDWDVQVLSLRTMLRSSSNMA
jgi:hypothetical protein